MDNNRKKIIVNEIQYWKENRLLPEQYCNYLLALYTEGNQPEESTKKSKQRSSKKVQVLLLLIPIFVFLLYFTELSFDLQIALKGLLMLIGIFITYYFFKKGIQFQVSLVISALMLLLLSVEITTHFYPGVLMPLYLVLFGNCGLWLLTGKKLKLLYFLISGYLGMVVLLISFFI
ncbi:hypothetical protein [Robertmurraya andreesenii]|uniref:Membrane protein n=1 Tax=Anoxybacillus andreesenii TaxID=1325932 RepID=A0ABT9V5X5_9BACL|nr:hypothetical protein [Robertmurraya andreesenii]MDQ0156352.1 putative membrane protein [Robertmurraya andreesenii]